MQINIFQAPFAVHFSVVFLCNTDLIVGKNSFLDGPKTFIPPRKSTDFQKPAAEKGAIFEMRTIGTRRSTHSPKNRH